MRLRNFLSIVPQVVKLWAKVLIGCALLIGLVAGYETAGQGNLLQTMSAYGSAALAGGVVLAIWLLCLGFVYADARRRHMRAVLWVVVATLFPHLLGFLLYFVLRHPMSASCSHCGMSVLNHQRFCSACGSSVVQPDPAGPPITPNPLQGASQ